jgi:hypothetical protein
MKASLFGLVALFVVSAQAQEIDYPESISLRFKLESPKGIQDVQNYNSKGLSSMGIVIHGGKAEIKVLDPNGNPYDALSKNLNVHMSAAKDMDPMKICRKSGFKALEEGGAMVVSVKEIPFHSLYNIPADMIGSRRASLDATALSSRAKLALKVAEKNAAEIAAQIAQARAELENAKNKQQQSRLSARIDSLEKRAGQILARAKAAYEKDMEKVQSLRERAAKLGDKVKAELQALLERQKEVSDRIAGLNEKIASALVKGNSAVAEKLKIQLLIAEDNLQKVIGEVAKASPGFRGHIGLNFDRLSVSCQQERD